MAWTKPPVAGFSEFWRYALRGSMITTWRPFKVSRLDRRTAIRLIARQQALLRSLSSVSTTSSTSTFATRTPRRRRSRKRR